MKRRFYQFHKNPLINFLYDQRLRRILNIIDTKGKKKTIMMDLGCSRGYFSRVLSERKQSTIIGLDIINRVITEAQASYRKLNLNFILADVSFIPFKNHSIDLIICASVLEHIINLDNAIKKIKDVIKEDGILIVGYPIETRFFKYVMRLFSPYCARVINQSWYQEAHKQESYWENPHTHKQTYRTIRDALRKNFLILRKEKLPFKIFPDSITYYEITTCTP